MNNEIYIQCQELGAALADNDWLLGDIQINPSKMHMMTDLVKRLADYKKPDASIS